MGTSNALIGITEAAAIVGVDPSTLRRWAKEGLVPSYLTPTNQRRFKREDLKDVIKAPAERAS